MADRKITESDVRFWLEEVFKTEDLSNFSVSFWKNYVQDNLFGDEYFVKLSENKDDGIAQQMHFILKCSKSEPQYRERFPIKQTYINEIYTYSVILKVFSTFQREKFVLSIFNSVPKYCGSYINENIEVLVFEDATEAGFAFHNPSEPMSIEQLELVVKEYGKFHAISAAIRDHDGDAYSELCDGLKDFYANFARRVNLKELYGFSLKGIRQLLEDKMTLKTGEKLLSLENQISFILEQLLNDPDYFMVITHGECCGSSYLFKYKNEDEHQPLKATIQNWQFSKVSHPVTDVLYFIYSCISSEDLKNFDALLESYYKSFFDHLTKLGGDPDIVYSRLEFYSDWKIFAKIGFLMSISCFYTTLQANNSVGGKETVVEQKMTQEQKDDQKDTNRDNDLNKKFVSNDDDDNESGKLNRNDGSESHINENRVNEEKKTVMVEQNVTEGKKDENNTDQEDKNKKFPFDSDDESENLNEKDASKNEKRDDGEHVLAIDDSEEWPLRESDELLKKRILSIIEHAIEKKFI